MVYVEGPELETGGTANLTTTARGVTPGAVTAHRIVVLSRRGRVSRAGYRKTVMPSARAAAYYVVGAGLLAAWLASAAGVSRSPVPMPRVPAPSAEAVQLDAVASDVQSQARRLRKRLAAAPAPQAPFRNPFAFVSAPAARPPRVRAQPIVPSPAIEDAVSEPDLVLIGVAEQGTTRTAMVGSGDELLMASEGQTLAGRYRVLKIAADAIELVDLGTGTTRRLFLKSPVSLP